MATLLLDIGNTRLKWAMLENGRLGPQSALGHAGWDRNDVTRLLRQIAQPRRVVIANVGGAAVGELLRESVQAEWGLPVKFVASTAAAGGVRNAYKEPAQLGVDRWLAMIGVRSVEAAPACVVSVGTAATVDALDGSGQHLGGVIVPGPDLMESSLWRNTGEIALRARQGSLREGIFADNTLGAVRQGAVHALAALVQRSIDVLETHVGKSPLLFLTGGASQRLEGLIEYPCRIVEDLVLRGLAVVESATSADCESPAD